MTTSIQRVSKKLPKEIFVWFGKYPLETGLLIDIRFDSTLKKFDCTMQYDVFYTDDQGLVQELSVAGTNIIEPKLSHSLGKSY